MYLRVCMSGYTLVATLQTRALKCIMLQDHAKLSLAGKGRQYHVQVTIIINARRMHTRVIVLTLCVCVKSLLTSCLVYTTK